MELLTLATFKPAAIVKHARNLIAKLFLIILGLFVGFILCEIGLRIAGVRYPVFDAYDSERGIKLKAYSEGWYTNEGSAYVRINSIGYRDTEHEVPKGEDAYRIAVLGDSFAEARQVALKDTFWKIMERTLQSHMGCRGRRIEVLNFGVGGYGTTEELQTLRKHVLGYSPDLVLLAFYCGNDVINNSKVLSWRLRKERLRPFYVRRNGTLVLDVSFNKDVKAIALRCLLCSVQYSRLIELTNHGLKKFKAFRLARNRKKQAPKTEVDDGNIHNPLYMPPEDKDWKEAWELTEALLEQFHREVSATGAKFALVTLTMGSQVDPNVEKTRNLIRTLGVDDLFYNERRLVEHGRKHGYCVIPLATDLQRIAVERNVYFHGFRNTSLGSGHWNETGHREAARIIVEHLIPLCQTS